jgi:hypothetical protein
MSTENFLNAVLPTQGHRFSLVNFGKQGDPDFRPVQRQFLPGDTVNLIEHAQWGSRQGGNSFFAVGGFNIGFNEKGNPARFAELAVWHRCLRLDLDCGAAKAVKGEGYLDKRTALLAILSFCQRFALPTPWLVDSGGGVHVYWAFDRDVSLQDWLPMAQRLQAACDAAGVIADSTTTCDAARVLRVPETINHKPELAKPVVRVMQEGHSVAPETIVANFPAVAPAIAGRMPNVLRSRGSELQANLHQPYFMRELLRQCPGMRAMLANGGASASEPLWKLALDLVNKSDNDEDQKWEVAKAISKGHSSYDEGALSAKWSQTQAQDYHPPTCNRLAGAGMRECKSCPLQGKISSPLVLGRPVLEAPRDEIAPAPMSPAATVADHPPAVAAVPLPPEAPQPPATPSVLPPPVPAFVQQIQIFEISNISKVKIIDGRLTSRLLVANGVPMQVKDSQPDANGVRTQYNQRFFDYKLLSVERMLDHSAQRGATVLTFERPKDGPVEVEFDSKDFAEPRNFYLKMHDAGLYAPRKDVTEFVEKFMTEFLAALQKSRAASQISGRCGWTEDMKSFVLGNVIYNDDGTSQHIRTAVAPGEMDGYHAAGDAAAWRAAFDIALSGGVDRQCVLALSIAGPLMVFTGLDGVLLNAYSPESGVGKSTLCDAALSIWGAPNVLRKDFRDTANATFKLASVMGNMPMVIDEFTNVEGKALSDYVYTITQGREKHRLGSDARLNQNAQRWCLAAIATSNNSVHEKLQDYRRDATAEAARVFELRLHPLVLTDEQLAINKDRLGALRSSYGFMGPALVKLFMGHPPAVWRALVMKKIQEWDRRASQSAGDRFRSATCALMEIGASLGASLGYAFDPAAVTELLASHWNKQVDEFEAERLRPVDFVNGFVLEHLSDLAQISTDSKSGATNWLNSQQMRKVVGETRGAIVNGQFRPTTVMIPLNHLREYVKDKHGNYKAVIEWLSKASIVSRIGMLGYLSGTNSQIQTQAVELQWNGVMGLPSLQAVDPPSQENVA